MHAPARTASPPLPPDTADERANDGHPNAAEVARRRHLAALTKAGFKQTWIAERIGADPTWLTRWVNKGAYASGKPMHVETAIWERLEAYEQEIRTVLDSNPSFPLPKRRIYELLRVLTSNFDAVVEFLEELVARQGPPGGPAAAGSRAARPTSTSGAGSPAPAGKRGGKRGRTRTGKGD